ncbi:unnamed protein product [Calypogeia fissa]
MAGNSVQALQAAGIVALIGVVLGLIVWPFEPKIVNVYGADVPKLILSFLIPVGGLVISLLLLLFVQCDPLIASHTPPSRASVGATIVLPTAIALVLHIIVLIAGLAGHVLGTSSIVFVSGLLLIGIGFIFYSIEQNYVVGIRDLWTLRSPQVWEKTHAWAYKFYVAAGIALVVLAFFLPNGFWAFVTIIGVFLLPTLASIGYSYVIREDQYSYIVR